MEVFRMKTTWFFAALVIGGLSSLCLAYSGGSGTAGNPYQIADANDLLELAIDTGNYDKSFILTADIDLTGQTFTAAVIAPDMDDSNYDFDGIEFTGILDGNGHQIKNLTINGDNHYIGLLGQIGVNGQIKNLAIVDATIQGNYYVGGLVGGNSGIISSCYTKGTVSGNGCVGGLAGVNSSGTIRFCHSAGSIDGINSIGGLVGVNYWGIVEYYEDTIRFCYATGEVSGDDSVGGLVGSNQNSWIISCFATGTVNGYSAVGGLLGDNEISSTMFLESNEASKIISCFATGRVSGYSIVGGLLGANAAGQVIDCYSTGRVTGTEEVGGLVGWSVSFEKHCETACSPSCVEVCNYDPVPDPTRIESSFWNTQTSRQSTSAGGTGKTLMEMRTLATFTSAGWDFTNETANGTHDTWRMCADGMSYPEPSWMTSPMGDFACPDGTDMQDLIVLAQNWLTSELVNPATFNYASDANGDGLIDQGDFSKLSQSWPGENFVQSSTVGACVMDSNSIQAQTSGLFSESLRFNVTVQGPMILFEDMVYTNCCKEDILLKATVASGQILLKEQVKLGGMCLCNCDFPVEAEIGPFEPGQYTFTVIQSENDGSGQLIGEVSVVIE
jgi:hypothetical protein